MNKIRMIIRSLRLREYLEKLKKDKILMTAKLDEAISTEFKLYTDYIEKCFTFHGILHHGVAVSCAALLQA